MMKETYQCATGHSAPKENFYLKKDGTPISTCKHCIRQKLNVDEPSTFLWILKELDIPYIEKTWKMTKEQSKVINQSACLNKYIQKLKLPGYRNYTYEDNAELNRMAKEEAAANEKVAILKKPLPGEIIIHWTDIHELGLEATVDLHNQLVEAFPNNRVITIPKKSTIDTMSREEIQQMIGTLQEILDENN